MSKESKKSVKENNILEAAYQLFIEKGFKNTSIQEIVDKADVGKGTFYTYFKNKEDSFRLSSLLYFYVKERTRNKKKVKSNKNSGQS